MAATATITIPPRSICCLQTLRPRNFSISSTSRQHSNGNGSFSRSDFQGQGFTGYYDPGQPTTGPLADASLIGAPRITPKLLKQHLDQYVVGQERAKKVLSVAVYNHYQRVQELQRREEEEEELLAQQQRREWTRHPVEDEYPGQQSTQNMQQGPSPPPPPHPQYGAPPPRYSPAPIIDDSPLNIEKSNVMLLGPSGVGKTLMAKTLAKVLEVPFSMSDCTPFTQAGYIGEDAEVCVHRLLAAADYDVARAQRGIIVLDEVDKIATARVSHGKDVSGEGVQQALLKIIEGTTIQVQAKQERSSGSPKRRRQYEAPNGNPAGGGNINMQQPGKGEVYNVNTENILFICTGAFIGLHKTIMDRVAKSSIGFGARLRTFPGPAGSSSEADTTDPTLASGDPTDDALFRNNLPFYEPPQPTSQTQTAASYILEEDESTPRYNTLDLTTPNDLQKFGLIPELVGRIPVTCAVSPLSLSALVRVLVEPKNSLTAQYIHLFSLSGIELRFTSPSLYEIAKAAQGMGTGARGLRTVLERLLGESMFECPGAGIRYVLVSEGAAKKEEGCRWYGRGGQGRFIQEAADEEEEWERRKRRRKGLEQDSQPDPSGRGGFESFSQYRENVSKAAGGNG